MQKLRDEPACADEERDARLDGDDPGLAWRLSYDADQDVAAPFVATGRRPRVAILREQGVNSQVEMAAAFDRAGFTAVDVHMTDLIDRRATLEGYQGLVACGGFSYGDVLGAGEGWAKSILFNPRARGLFEGWFARTDRFTLGVCNGCQMLAALAELIPGTASWPRFRRNRSEQFEGRLSMVEIAESNSIFFAGMAGSQLPIAVAHGEGRAVFASTADARCRARPGGAAIHRQWRARRRALPGEPERLARGHRRPCLERWNGHYPDAAPGTRVPHRAEFLAPRERRRGQRLDADVQERAALGRLTLSSRARTSPAGPPPLARKNGHSLAPGSRNGLLARSVITSVRPSRTRAGLNARQGRAPGSGVTFEDSSAK